MTAAKTFSFRVVDRDIRLQPPTDGQLAAAMKILDVAKRETEIQNRRIKEAEAQGKEPEADFSKVLQHVSKILRIIDMMIVSEDDRDYVEDMMIQDKLKLEDLIGLIQFIGLEEKEQAPKAGPKPRARRAS